MADSRNETCESKIQKMSEERCKGCSLTIGCLNHNDSAKSLDDDARSRLELAVCKTQEIGDGNVDRCRW